MMSPDATETTADEPNLPEATSLLLPPRRQPDEQRRVLASIAPEQEEAADVGHLM